MNKEQIMDILINYLPKEGVSKTRDKLSELLTPTVNVEKENKKSDVDTNKDYEVQLKRKEWKVLSEMEKELFVWFKKELNGDEACSAMFAVDLYEEIIKPYLSPNSQSGGEEIRKQYNDAIDHLYEKLRKTEERVISQVIDDGMHLTRIKDGVQEWYKITKVEPKTVAWFWNM